MIDDLLAEEVVAMPALSMALIEAWAGSALDTFAPQWRIGPQPLDIVSLIDNVLPQHGIYVAPATAAELGHRHAATDPTGSGEINILVGEELWDDLYSGGRRANFARATVGHELGHALMHVHVVRRRLSTPQHEHLLARQMRRDLPAYRDPEWQAWAFAGALLVPRQSVVMLDDPSVSDAANVFEVSESFVQAHLRRLRLVLRAD